MGGKLPQGGLGALKRFGAGPTGWPMKAMASFNGPG
jgi:hypothetical protein